MRRLLFGLLLLLALSAWGAEKLVVGTGAPGGVYVLYGKGLADLFGWIPRQTAGAVENLKLIRSGEAQLAFATVDSAYDAVRGVGAYVDGGPVPAKTVAVLYPSLLHIVALQSGPCKTFRDLAGKRVSLGSPGSSSQIATGRILRLAEIPVIPSFLGVADAAKALQAGEIDAFFWISGLPCEAIQGISQPVRLLDATPYLDDMRAKYGPVYTAAPLPGGLYQGVPGDTPAISINNILACRASLPDEVVYGLLKTMFSRLPEVRQVHPEAARLSKTWCSTGSSIDFHPGALRFYAEK